MANDFLIIPTTEAPSQTINVTLNNQVCRINLFTKSINVPKQDPLTIPTNPPTYENINPVFLNLYLNDVLLLGGALCLNNTRIIRDTYFGFIGDLSFYDTQGNNDPYGISFRLPPPFLRNVCQRAIPLKYRGLAPPEFANKCPGLGTRFLLLYWPDLA